MTEKKQHKIQDKSKWYSFLRKYVDFSLFQAYRKIEYVHLENIPQDGSIIYAPNHTNALMDALVVLCIDENPKVFVARADIFKNPILAKVLSFLKMMPIMRIRDGIEEVKKNNETIDLAVDVLMDKVPFCILPEGRHRAQHSLLPLSKGIFRIALQAQEVMKDNPIYIVPCGLEYGNFFRFRSTVLTQIGRPINVQEYMAAHSELTHPELMNLLKSELAERMKEVILYIPDDDNYYATYEICAALINKQVDNYLKFHPNEKRNSLLTRYHSNRTTLAQVHHLTEEQPEIAQEMFDKANEIYDLRRKARISLSSVVMKYPLWSSILKLLIFIVTLPYTIPASIVVLPISIISRVLGKKLKDEAFFNSIRYFVTLILWPILLLIYSIIIFCTTWWPWAIFAIAALIPANLVAPDAFRLFRLLWSDIALLFNKNLRTKLNDLRKYYLQHITL